MVAPHTAVKLQVSIKSLEVGQTDKGNMEDCTYVQMMYKVDFHAKQYIL